MKQLVKGLHHITGLASSAQKNFDFYAGILGLRLVKKTINFDAPEVYHLYYGNEVGAPGTIMTFFPYEGLSQGKKGKGQLTVTAFSVPADSFEYWMKRLNKFKISFESPKKRFDEQFIYLEDFDGTGLELVANDRDSRPAYPKSHVPSEFGIKGFYSITLSEEGFEKTAALLTKQLNFRLIGESANRFRFTTDGKPGNFADILCSPDTLRGLPGAGTIHHVAFATDNDNTQVEARHEIVNAGLNVTPVIDREYFHSIYFREPGGVLFEIATLPPGFSVDEATEHLGETLKLPPWMEKHRGNIERSLANINSDLTRFED